MSVTQVNAHLRALRSELTWRPAGSYAHKAVAKLIDVAEKVRELQQGREVAGDV